MEKSLEKLSTEVTSVDLKALVSKAAAAQRRAIDSKFGDSEKCWKQRDKLLQELGFFLTKVGSVKVEDTWRKVTYELLFPKMHGDAVVGYTKEALEAIINTLREIRTQYQFGELDEVRAREKLANNLVVISLLYEGVNIENVGEVSQLVKRGGFEQNLSNDEDLSPEEIELLKKVTNETLNGFFETAIKMGLTRSRRKQETRDVKPFKDVKLLK